MNQIDYDTIDIKNIKSGIYLYVIEGDIDRREIFAKIYNKFVVEDFEIFSYKAENKWSIKNFRDMTLQYSKLVDYKKKVIFIEDIDKAERRIYSVLLKSFEENSNNSIFILTAKNGELPDVILSRVTRVYHYNTKKVDDIDLILEKIGVAKDSREWLIKSKLPSDFILDENNKAIINKIILIDKIINEKKLDVKTKAKEIYSIIKEVNKYKKNYDLILVKWLNEYLKDRSVTYLFKKDLITGYEKIKIIERHEKNITYNVNLELYIYSLLLTLAK